MLLLAGWPWIWKFHIHINIHIHRFDVDINGYINVNVFLAIKKWWRFCGNVPGGGQRPDAYRAGYRQLPHCWSHLVRDQCVRRANNVHGGMFSGNCESRLCRKRPRANKMLIYRRETALQGLDFAKSGRLQLGDNILRTSEVYLQPLWHNRPAKLLNSVLHQKRPFCVFEPPSLWGVGLGATYDDHLRLIGKCVVDFLLVLIELFSLGVTA